MAREQIRNFCIIAHIDHGKSTLADRFLELTGTIEKRKMQEQVLDAMDLERERGITIKMTPVQMHWKGYVLNLIDTPGHVDFSYEVSRALAAVEGAILLVDATKGVQAQTLAHLAVAQKQNLVIIPVINKIDLESARIKEVEEEIRKLFPESGEIYKISAKEGRGVEELLKTVIELVPPPRKSETGYSRALIFDSHYDSYKGVLAYVRVFDGILKQSDTLRFLAVGRETQIVEIGSFRPELTKAQELGTGAIGYVATGLKEPDVIRVGDTIVAGAPKPQTPNPKPRPLAGYQEPRPIVFASVFPAEGLDFKVLKDAFVKLKLTDWALTFEPESSEVLGRGFRCGFLGSLHLEIILERLRREFDLSFVATTPSVGYEIKLVNDSLTTIASPSRFPEAGQIKEVREPWVRLTIFTPESHVGVVMQLLNSRRGVWQNTEYLTAERAEIIFEIPLAEIISDFYDKLKSISSGFASLSYEPVGYRSGDLQKLNILVAGEPVEALAQIVPKEKAYGEGRRVVKRLKELLPRELFTVSLQASLAGRVIARETIPALKKDVTGYLYGGDVTRKKKLWAKQKKGKKRMRAEGRVHIPSRVFTEILKR